MLSICSRSICSVVSLIVHTLKTLPSSTRISTVLCGFQLGSTSPDSLESCPHVLYFSHALNHIRYLEVSAGGVTEILSLRPIISLPTLAKRMVHSIISEIIIFEIKVVEIVTAGLYLLSLQDSNELSLCFPKSYHNFYIFG